MDPINQNTVQNQMPPENLPKFQTVSPAGNNKKIGPIIVGLVVVLLIIIGALYVFASKLNQQPPVTTPSTASSNTPVNTNVAAPVQSVAPITNTKDDLQSLQNDLNSSTNGVSSQGI